MASKKKLLQAAAGVGGAGLDVDEVYSTYVFDGNGSTQTITNGLDLSTEGGLVIVRARDSGANTFFWDTERGATQYIMSASTQQQISQQGVTAFNTDGFNLGSYGGTNNSSFNYGSWSFRKAPKFFDVVTYTGTGVNRTISHGLGSTPGMIIVKRTDSTSDWSCYHRGLNGGTNPATKYIRLNLNNAESGNSGYWNNTEPTDSVFSVGTNAATNSNGGSYVAYLFAHNNSDGDFGPDGDQDIIECGYYTGNSSSFPSINLGFEPQWLMIKNATSGAAASDWILIDNIRGVSNDTSYRRIKFNETSAEDDGGAQINITPTGFKFIDASTALNETSSTYIYVAIRRGPLAEPESATDVFDVFKQTNGNGVGNSVVSATDPPFPIDLLVHKWTASSREWDVADRLRGSTKFLQTNSTNAEATETGWLSGFDRMKGYKTGSNGGVFYGTTDSVGYFWKRAPGYFDVVSYTGTGSAVSVNHNLGVIPEMIWVKKRDSALNWNVVGSVLGGTNSRDNYIHLNLTNAMTSFVDYRDANDTATTFGVRTGNGYFDSNGSKYIAYLFATLAGISKVGSYTGTGAAQNIDCGFSSGARFVLIRRTDVSDNWEVFDTERGIVAGNDPRLSLDDNAAEYTGNDFVDPYSSGFAVTTELSSSGGNYIFYAIA